jgi:hypothetical protein
VFERQYQTNVDDYDNRQASYSVSGTNQLDGLSLQNNSFTKLRSSKLLRKLGI